ncbi:M15 family metallopeptidase [Nocardia cyriacigeorgica]|uniref:M15 family metallopeptidase n=1 Tax=Nocardia cyriacigeorgica TaxID=135487 RepID=UPI00189530F7|nr:M15 family metallopeptidase [Nocardia cyriacigeorgica]MBF6435294.1 M15 family metallopeptidase [Nocardia cyriacigeorgica]
MNHSEPARTAPHRSRSGVIAACVLAGAALAGALVHQSPAQLSASTAAAIEALRGERQGPPGAATFDDGIPSVSDLDPALLDALRRASADAAADGVELVVTSGRRSPEYQDQLLRAAVAKYGSPAEAARWVATAETSAHVSGDAVDIGPTEATAWLSAHGAEYGLCQIYRNEPWHFELRPAAVDDGCPAQYSDPTEDPRMGR